MPVAPCFLLQAIRSASGRAERAATKQGGRIQPTMKLVRDGPSRPRWRRKTKRSPRTPGIRPGPSKTLDHLKRGDRDREQGDGAERRKPRADPEHQRNRHRGFRNGSDVDPYLGRVETSLGKKARGRRRHRAGCKFPHHVRKEKQAADDPEDVPPVGEIKILGLDLAWTEIFLGRPHGEIPSRMIRRLQSPIDRVRASQQVKGILD
jgi:hypothetical protein